MCIRDRFYTLAGPEIAVATTKAYSTQLIAGYLLAVQFAKVRGQIDEKRYSSLVKDLLALPDKMKRVLEDKERIQWFAAKFANAKDIFFIGRGIDYAVSMEGSLKMKEISYIHSEAYEMCIRDSHGSAQERCKFQELREYFP